MLDKCIHNSALKVWRATWMFGWELLQIGEIIPTINSVHSLAKGRSHLSYEFTIPELFLVTKLGYTWMLQINCHSQPRTNCAGKKMKRLTVTRKWL